MKMLRRIAQISLIVPSLVVLATHAQVYPRRYPNRQVPGRMQTPVAPVTGAHTNALTRTTNAPAIAMTNRPPTVVTQVIVRVIQPPPDPEKTKAAKAEATRRTVEFQKQRADEGSESAQYELGMRYLKGDGVEKDDALGRKWLTQSSKGGFNAATIKLQELDREAKEK